MNNIVIYNFKKLKFSILFIPIVLILMIVSFLYTKDAWSIEGYIAVQKELFFELNTLLAPYPILENNLTQMGDALIFLSLLSLLIIYAPKLWEALLSASLFSLLFSITLKKVFAVPRPAAVFDQNSFSIVGRVLTGHNSLPSGHSITVFTILSVLLIAFMPRKTTYKIVWITAIILLGLMLISSRVAVGTHYPLDTVFGGLIGCVSGLLGIFFSRKFRLWNWINSKKFYPIFIVLFVGCGIALIQKISKENLLVFYLALTALLFSLYRMITIYVKK